MQVFMVVAEQLREELASGSHEVGGWFLSERDVGDRFGVARMTAQRALRALEEEGLLVSEVGRGRRVRAIPEVGVKPPSLEDRLARIESMCEEILKRLRP